MLYAVGEIALVVIGILIALQVNNWNEFRRLMQKEVTILHEVKENINRNINILNFHKRFSNLGLQSCDILIDSYSNQLPYSDSLEIHLAQAFSFRIPTLSNSAYESLKSTGLELVRPSLREQTIELYDMYYSHLENSLTRMTDSNINPNTVSFILENFISYRDENSQFKLQPSHVEELLRNPQYLNLLYYLKTFHETFTMLYDESIDKSNEVYKIISKELAYY